MPSFLRYLSTPWEVCLNGRLIRPLICVISRSSPCVSAICNWESCWTWVFIHTKQTLYRWATPVGLITYFLVEKHIVASMKPIKEKQNNQLCIYVGGIGKQPQGEAGFRVGHEDSVSVSLDACCVCEMPQLQDINFLCLISKNPSQNVKECLRLHLLHKSWSQLELEQWIITELVMALVFPYPLSSESLWTQKLVLASWPTSLETNQSFSFPSLFPSLPTRHFPCSIYGRVYLALYVFHTFVSDHMCTMYF